jgi:hypothetical protein
MTETKDAYHTTSSSEMVSARSCEPGTADTTDCVHGENKTRGSTDDTRIKLVLVECHTVDSYA